MYYTPHLPHLLAKTKHCGSIGSIKRLPVQAKAILYEISLESVFKASGLRPQEWLIAHSINVYCERPERGGESKLYVLSYPRLERSTFNNSPDIWNDGAGPVQRKTWSIIVWLTTSNCGRGALALVIVACSPFTMTFKIPPCGGL